MNAVANPDSDSDSDSNSIQEIDVNPEYYEPISIINGEDENSDDDEPTFHALPNGYAHCLENGVSSIDLGDSEDDDEEEEEERVREAAVQRAFVEDENRRNAPLTPENATRVREAMRGISFGGFPPDRFPEDLLINQLRMIRQQRQPQSSTTS